MSCTAFIGRPCSHVCCIYMCAGVGVQTSLTEESPPCAWIKYDHIAHERIGIAPIRIG